MRHNHKITIISLRSTNSKNNSPSGKKAYQAESKGKTLFLKFIRMHTDSDLISSTKAGNQQAFKLIIQRHEPQIRSTLIGMLGPSSEIDDIIQNVFIRFYKAINNFRADAALSTYLTRIAINLAINEINKKQKRQKRFSSLTSNSHAYQLADKNGMQEKHEMNDLIKKALKELDPEFRVVVVLRLIEGYSVKETAEILELPTGTIASRLSRAQKKLRNILKDTL